MPHDGYQQHACSIGRRRSVVGGALISRGVLARADRLAFRARSVLWSGIALVVGITIGSGIFRIAGRDRRARAEPALMLGVWVLGGVITLCGALSLAELAAALPRDRRVLRLSARGLGTADGVPVRLVGARR